MSTTRLDQFDNSDYRLAVAHACPVGPRLRPVLPGVPLAQRLKRTFLSLFGANVGRGVVLKPRVTIKYPWKLAVGDHCWIGENVWIDNLGQVTLGNHCYLSQGALLCATRLQESHLRLDGGRHHP